MPTTIKAALKKWEEASGKKSSEAKEIKLIGVYPPIEKMEGPLHILVNCEKLSLSTNLIVNIQNLQVLKNLKVLSLGRNLIKSLQARIISTSISSIALSTKLDPADALFHLYCRVSRVRGRRWSSCGSPTTRSTS